MEPIRLGTGRHATVRMINGQEYKFCPDCDGWLPVTEFYKNRELLSGYCREHYSKRTNPKRKEAMETIEAAKRIGRWP